MKNPQILVSCVLQLHATLCVTSSFSYSELLVKENGSLIQEGDLLVNPKLGATLRRIADDPMAYYNGTLADDIVADLMEYGPTI